MKKIILSSVLLMTTVFAFAQKPLKGDNTFTFGISGLSTIAVSAPQYTGTIMFKHLIANDMAARVGINMISAKNGFTQAGYLTDSIKNTSSSNGFGLSLGLQKSFKGTDRLETYIGADLLIGTAMSKSNNFTQMAANSTVTVDTKNGKTMKFGFVPCVGLNYYIAPWLALGAEFGWGFLSTSTADGTATTTTVIAGSTTTSTAHTGKTTVSGFQTAGHGMITITAAFH